VPAREAIRQFYRGQLARPGLPALFFNPFYFARRGLYLAMREFAGDVTGRVLDVGCGSRPYEALFAASAYVGLEIDTPENRATKRADLYYDGGAFPVASASFDTVLCNQVLEHVFTPAKFLGEVRRVLKPGGRLLLSVPFAWDEHEQPVDYARYASFGLTALLREEGFEILQHRKTMADVRAVCQIANAYLYKVTATGSRIANLAAALVLMAPVNLAGSLLRWVTPRNPDFYLDNVVLARKMEGR
jgi:SAM-dependent methyltransferase